MDAILGFFNFVVFEAFGAPVTMLEIIAFVAGAACVYGVAKQYQWNWPVAIINAVAFIFLFVGVGLYADALLQFVFIGLSVYGWIYWGSKGRSNGAIGKSSVPVRHSTLVEAAILSVAASAAIVGVSLFLDSATNSTVPVFDAAILVGSLVATYYQAKKVVESWWIWIAVDIISIPLYFYKGLALTGILYMVFLALCIKGLIEWSRDLRKNRLVSDIAKIPTASIPLVASAGDMRTTPIDNPLDFRADGSIQKGDPAYDALMEVMDSGQATSFNQNADGTWETTKHA